MYPTLSRCRRRLASGVSFHWQALARRIGWNRPIYFCLSSGRCGSAAIVRLLQTNGIRNCYHELRPDLLVEGIDYYQQELEAEAVAVKLGRTRRGIFFESNNRLFSLAGPIQMAFPQARFVHLFRDGRDVVRSGLARGWYRREDRFRNVRLGMDAIGSPFAKVCRYWADVNQRIVSDLRALGGGYLELRFEDLIQGRGVDQLEDYLGVRLTRCRVMPPTNCTKTWTVPPYPQWDRAWRQQFHDICGPTMTRLGYPLSDERQGPNEPGPDEDSHQDQVGPTLPEGCR